MIKMPIRLLLLLSMLVSFSGCIKLFEADGVGSLPELRMSVTTWPDSVNRRLHLKLDGGEFDYRNVVIKTELTQTGSRSFELKILGTECDGSCIESSYDGDMSAEGQAIFPVLSNGEYLFSIIKKNQTSVGFLRVTDYGYFFDIDVPRGITFNRKFIGRIPDDAVWLSFYYAPSSQARNDLLDSLSVVGEFTPLILPQGYYGPFEIESNGSIDYEQLGSECDTAMIYRYNGNMSGFESAYLNWKQSHPNSYDFIRVVIEDALRRNEFLSQ